MTDLLAHSLLSPPPSRTVAFSPRLLLPIQHVTSYASPPASLPSHATRRVGRDHGAVPVDDRSRCAPELPAARERADSGRVLHRCVRLAWSCPLPPSFPSTSLACLPSVIERAHTLCFSSLLHAIDGTKTIARSQGGGRHWQTGSVLARSWRAGSVLPASFEMPPPPQGCAHLSISQAFLK